MFGSFAHSAHIFLESQRSYVPTSVNLQQLSLGILAEGAMTLPVTLSGGVLFAS